MPSSKESAGVCLNARAQWTNSFTKDLLHEKLYRYLKILYDKVGQLGKPDLALQPFPQVHIQTGNFAHKRTRGISLLVKLTRLLDLQTAPWEGLPLTKMWDDRSKSIGTKGNYWQPFLDVLAKNQL